MPDIDGRLSDGDKAKIEKWFKGLNIDQCSTCKRSGAWWYVGESAVPLPASMPRARPFSYYPGIRNHLPQLWSNEDVHRRCS